MKRLLSQTVAVLITAASLTGCELISGLFKSDDARILSFSMDRMIGEATIDQENRTVELTIEPANLSILIPTLTVSTNATFTVPTLVDDRAVLVEVTAEDGSIVEWNVTVHVQFGLSFRYGADPVSVTLTRGMVHSEDAAADEAFGSGTPPCIRYTPGEAETLVIGLAEDLDEANGESAGELVLLRFGSDAPGYLSSDDISFTYRAGMIVGSLTNDEGSPASFTVSIDTYGEVGGKVTGTFSGTVTDDLSTEYPVQEGFFKALRLADDTAL